jgi:hypothetical protein
MGNQFTMNEDIQIGLKQVWKRKGDGLSVRVRGLIFVEPKRVMWQAMPNQGHPSAYEIITESEFKHRYEYLSRENCLSELSSRVAEAA